MSDVAKVYSGEQDKYQGAWFNGSDRGDADQQAAGSQRGGHG
jgi:hypothetical protein